MSDQVSSDTGAAAASAAPPASFSSPEQAARFLSEKRARAAAPESKSEESALEATSDEPELSHEDNTDPETALGETQDNDAEAERLPPVDRPRSWSKDDDDDWNALPRARQEKIAANERAREAEINRRINESAEKLKGLAAKEQAAEQARQNYESQVNAALSMLEREQLSKFPDIRTTADVSKLAETDPLRYLQWQAHQNELGWATAEKQKADERKAGDDSNAWKTFLQAENAKAIEAIPDLGDKVKGPKLMEKALATLQDIGFTAEDLGKYEKGEKLSPFDHRFQRILVDAIRYRDLQAAKTAVVKKDVPPVQRPGARAPAGQAQSENIKALTARLANSGSIKDAAALRAAKRAAQNRSN